MRTSSTSVSSWRSLARVAHPHRCRLGLRRTVRAGRLPAFRGPAADCVGHPYRDRPHGPVGQRPPHAGPPGRGGADGAGAGGAGGAGLRGGPARPPPWGQRGPCNSRWPVRSKCGRQGPFAAGPRQPAGQRPGTHPTGTTATVRVDQIGDQAQIEVRDSGPGMPDEDARRVFERFFRADPARTRTSRGSGLGFSIVSAIVAAHGGSVSAASKPGEGLVVTVLLPRCRQLFRAFSRPYRSTAGPAPPHSRLTRGAMSERRVRNSHLSHSRASLQAGAGGGTMPGMTALAPSRPTSIPAVSPWTSRSSSRSTTRRHSSAERITAPAHVPRRILPLPRLSSPWSTTPARTTPTRWHAPPGRHRRAAWRPCTCRAKAGAMPSVPPGRPARHRSWPTWTWISPPPCRPSFRWWHRCFPGHRDVTIGTRVRARRARACAGPSASSSRVPTTFCSSSRCRAASAMRSAASRPSAVTPRRSSCRSLRTTSGSSTPSCWSP